MDKTVLIMIAYKARGTLESFYYSLPKNLVNEIILVDDASGDGTADLSRSLGIETYENIVNLGYGGNMKRAIEIALSKGANIIVDIHPDGEYLPSAISLALSRVREEGAEFVLGNRFITPKGIMGSGMYKWKIPPTMLLNWLCRIILQLPIGDFHQGFRVYTRSLLEKVNYKQNSNNYLFSMELMAQAAYVGAKVMEVPVETLYVGDKRGASLKNSIRYTIGTLSVLWVYLKSKVAGPDPLFLKG